MTLLEEIQNGENAALEFKEARPKDSLKFPRPLSRSRTGVVDAFSSAWRTRLGGS